MDNTITITPSGIAIGSPLVAGTQLSVTATGMEVAEDAALFLIVTSRFPDLLVASCPLSETTTEGEYAGTLYTATKQMSLFLVNARADEARSASIELVDTAHGASLARTTVPIYNSSLIPQPCRWPSASPLYVPGPAASVLVGTTATLPPGSSASVENVGTSSDAVLNFGIPQGDPGTSIPLPVSVANGGTGATTAAGARANLGALSQAEAEAGFTEWRPAGDDSGYSLISATYERTQWTIVILEDGETSPMTFTDDSGPDVTEITFSLELDGIVRTRLPTMDDIPTLAAPSTDASAQGKAADAKATGDALAGKQDTIPDLATIRSGAAAGATAVQPSALATVATTGDYDDLTNKPTIPPAQIQSDWNQTNAEAVDFIKNKPTIPGPAPSPSTATPQMDGAGAAGSATTYARGDHRHPSDTSRLSTSGGEMDSAAQISWSNDGILGVDTYYISKTGIGCDSPTPNGSWIKRWDDLVVKSDLRYAFASPTPTVSVTSATVACEDRAINDFTVAPGITSLTITPPAAATGRARDFFCRVTLTDSSLPTVTLSGGTIDIGATELTGMTQGVNLLMFTEIASGHWLASRRSAS